MLGFKLIEKQNETVVLLNSAESLKERQWCLYLGTCKSRIQPYEYTMYIGVRFSTKHIDIFVFNFIYMYKQPCYMNSCQFNFRDSDGFFFVYKPSEIHLYVAMLFFYTVYTAILFGR